MPAKHESLAALARVVPVPPFVAIDDAQLDRLWRNAPALREQARAVFDSLRLTAGAFLDRDLAKLDAIAEPVWVDDADAQLARWLTRAGLDGDDLLAVRSSGGIEDGGSHSFAGVFESLLRVQGGAMLRQAIARVWRSAFSRRAAIERLRCGLLQAPLAMTVIVQRMVPARWAGVAFSHDPVDGRPELLVEAVRGSGDALVAGAADAFAVRWDADGPHGDAPLLAQRHLLVEVAAAVHTVEDRLGTAADVEWAWDGEQLWVLQGRPITSLASASELRPCAEWTDLYLAPDEQVQRLRPLPGFANYFRSKRRPLALLGQAQGVASGTALLVRANAAGLADPARMDALCAPFSGPQVVLDVCDGLRQQVLATHELPARLREVLGAQATVFVVRDYLRGEWGLITQPTGPEGEAVLCECSRDGLLAINRGSAHTQSFTLAHGTATGEAAAAFAPEQHAQLQRTTQAALQRFGPVQLEWVSSGGTLRLIDFSPLRQFHQAAGDDEAQGLRIISTGFAQGAPLVVRPDAELEDVSVAATVSINHLPAADSLGPAVVRLAEQARAGGGSMIVVAPRPYAALAALIPYVSGFVFEQASMLCHLAVLLRESQLPAVASSALHRRGLGGETLTIDAQAHARAHAASAWKGLP